MRKILLVLFLLSLSSPALATDWCADANIVACWTFEEGSGTSTSDVSSNSYDGTFTGDGEPAWYNTSTAGAWSSWALDFDGSNDRISIGTADILTENGSLAIVAWINPDADQNGAILSRRTTAGSAGTVDFRIQNDVTKSLRFRVVGSTSLLRQSVADSISTGVWNHVAVTWDGSTTASNIVLYVNGSEVTYQTTTNGSALYDNSGGTTKIGNIFDNLVQYNGKMDDLAYFTSGIDSTDINDIMDNGLVATGAPPQIF
jgi:hypothetical protein